MNKFLRVLPALALSALAVIIPTAVLPQLKFDLAGEKPAPKESVYAGVLELWHIETFEGGTASRAQWLAARALEFEKLYPRLFVMVEQKTLAELEWHILRGEYPDLVSFPTGAGEPFAGHTQAFTQIPAVRGELLRAGQLGGRQLALPYMTGGYALIANAERLKAAGVKESNKLSDKIFSAAYEQKSGKNTKNIFSLSVATPIPQLPLAAYCDKMLIGGFSLNVCETAYLAYEDFMGLAKSSMLLGTQRDIARIEARISQNNCPELRIEYTPGFCDMVQYVSVTTAQNFEAAQKFALYLADGAQKSVYKCGMFSADGKKYYSQPMRKEMEEALSGTLKTCNAFVSAAELARIKAAVDSALDGSKEAAAEVKRFYS